MGAAFRLLPLLRLREALERQAQRRLALALQAEGAARRALEDLQARRAALFATRRVPLGAWVDVAAWRAGEAYLRQLDRQRQTAESELASALEAVRSRRWELQQAHQEHERLLRLRERHAQAQALDAQRREAAALDERAVLRHAAPPHALEVP